MHYFTQCREFYQEFRRAYTSTGSILPSSRGLARALATPFRRRQGPARVLEVGPGTGSVTDEILRHMGDEDRLDIVDVNAHFVEVIRRRLDEEPHWKTRRAQTVVIHSPLQDLPGTATYDYVISGIPLNNFSVSLVREIFQAYQRLLKPAGTLSYFEYIAIRDLKLMFVSKSEQRRLRVLNNFLQRRIRAFQVDEQQVFMNVPPAVARHFCFST